MAPFSAWLPVRSETASDLVLKMVGAGAVGLVSGATALAQACAGLGLRVVADSHVPEPGAAGSAVRVRVSSDAATSMGSGCDVAACVDCLPHDETWAELQPGSVLLHEAGGHGLGGAPPRGGVITYAVPFAELHRGCGSHASGKGLIAAGVLARLLGLSPDLVRSRIRPASGVRYFDAGATYASTHLEKRDIHTLPVPADPRPQVLLNARQALRLGLAWGPCDCGSACADKLHRSPGEWLDEHADTTGLRPPRAPHRLPALQGYRSPDSEVTAWLGGTDLPDLLARQPLLPALVLVAADLLDAITLMRLARRTGRTGVKDAWVVLEDALVARQHSVPMDAIVGLVDPLRHLRRSRPCPASPSEDWRPQTEQDVEEGATVGYVAWGTAQGAVREALSVCRGFGLRVAALFPKVLWPPPVPEVEAFAGAVDRLVVVEPARTGAYTGFLRRWTSRPVATVMPQPGRSLTAMDIFMREGLGA